MVDTKEGSIVLRRSKEARVLRLIGVVVYSTLSLTVIGSLIFDLIAKYWNILLAVVLLTFMRGFLISIRELFRRVVLLDKYISFTSLNPIPRVYSYDQISEVETVEIKEEQWSIEPETYVKVTFEDGKILKVQKSLMSVREFRKHLSEKAGRKFRKTTKKKRITNQRS